MKKKPVKTKKTTPWKLDYRTWRTATLLGIAPRFPHTGHYDIIHRDWVIRMYAIKDEYINLDMDTMNIVSIDEVRQA